jgi:hypothetical protein
MKRESTLLALACLLTINCWASSARAGDGCCCAHCGCEQSCQKVCRLVCEDKKVDVTCWGVVDEDFCLPKHNKPNCDHCKMVCADCDAPCDPKAPYVEPKRFVWTDWIPGCATMHCRRKLYKKVETQKVPSFKWVVEDLCPHCESNCDVVEVSPEDKVSAPPQMADAKLLYRLK